MKRILEYALKHCAIIQSLYRSVFGTLFRLAGIFVKTDDHLVLLNSYGGRAYNDSPKVIFESMIVHPLFKKYRYVWSFDKPDRFTVPNAKSIRIDSPEYFLTALKAKIWISNVNIERGLRFKKKKTVYLNSWHGTCPKTWGNAVNGRRDYDFSAVDILCCDGEYSKKHFINDFNALEKNMLFSGRPREDALYRLSEAQIRDYRRLLDLPEEKRVILYAPTWRESRNPGRSCSIEIPIHVEKWRQALQDDFVILFRAHLLTEQISGIVFDPFFRNLFAYPDINHLYAVADVMISDYSSAFSDFAILEKPMICYAYDYDEYVRSRGVDPRYYENFPGGILTGEDQVIDRIRTMDYTEECRKTAEFRKKLISRGNNATEMCIARLVGKIAGK